CARVIHRPCDVEIACRIDVAARKIVCGIRAVSGRASRWRRHRGRIDYAFEGWIVSERSRCQTSAECTGACSNPDVWQLAEWRTDYVGCWNRCGEHTVEGVV